MELHEEPVTTDIAEEPAAPPKKRKHSWLVAGLGAILLTVAIAVLIVAVRPARETLPGPTAEDLEQQKYDAEHRQTQERKAAQLRNDPFLVRKEDESQRQLNSLLKDLNVGKDTGANFPIPLSDRQAKAEEEAIAGVLRDPGPAPAYSGLPPTPRRTAAQTSPGGTSESTAPMSPSHCSNATGKHYGPKWRISSTISGQALWRLSNGNT